MKTYKITVRITEDEKRLFMDYCDSMNSNPSKELRKCIIGILNHKESHISVGKGRNINILFMNIYHIINNCKCSDEDINELLKLLNELENSI